MNILITKFSTSLNPFSKTIEKSALLPSNNVQLLLLLPKVQLSLSATSASTNNASGQNEPSAELVSQDPQNKAE